MLHQFRSLASLLLGHGVKQKSVLAYAISFMDIDGIGKFCHSTV